MEEEYKGEKRMGRPRKYPYLQNKRDPNRKKMREIMDLSGWTKEQKEARRLELALAFSKKEGEKQRRLRPIRESDMRLKSKKEKDEFRKYINPLNKQRLDAILNDEEKMWEIFGDRGDFTTAEINEMRKENREKNKGNWISDKEIEEAMNRIYGGYGGGIEEDEEDGEYHNPYGELPY